MGDKEKELEKKYEQLVSELKGAKVFSEGILDSMLDGLVVADLDGNIIRVNKAFLKRVGYTDEKEVVGKFALDIWPIGRQDMEKYLRLMKEVIEKGSAGPIEVIGTTKDGKEALYSTVTCSSLRDSQGKPYALFAVIRDIRQTKKLISELKGVRTSLEQRVRERTAELEEAKAFAESILNSMVDSVVVVDMDGMIKKVNRSGIEQSGFTEEELLSMDGARLLSKEDIPRTVFLQKELLKKGFLADVEITELTKDNKRVPVSLTLALLKDAKGKPTGVIAVSRNITERKKAEEAIRESEEKLSSIFEAALDAIVYLDASGNLITFNKRLGEILGYKSEELVGKNFTDLGILDPSDVPRFVKQVSQISSTGKTTKDKHLEITLIRKDGDRIPVEINSNIVKKDGKPVGFAAVIRDITERKKIEDEEKKRTEELERFTKLAVGRELKMIELKKQLKEANLNNAELLKRIKELEWELKKQG